MACQNRAVTGFFDGRTHGQGVVQFREKKNSKKKIKFELKITDRKKQEKTMTTKEFAILVSNASQPNTPEKNIQPKNRKPSDYSNPTKSAQTRKNRLPTKDDKARYKKIKSRLECRPNISAVKARFWSQARLLQGSI